MRMLILFYCMLHAACTFAILVQVIRCFHSNIMFKNHVCKNVRESQVRGQPKGTTYYIITIMIYKFIMM